MTESDPSSGTDAPHDRLYCRFGKRDLDKTSWLAPLFNNHLGDLLNIELRHEQLFFIQGNSVIEDVGYSEKGTRFSEADFGKPIRSLDDLKRLGYWLHGPVYDPDTMRQALEQQDDGFYYSIFSNQCQDWADRLKKTAERIKRDQGLRKKRLADGPLPPQVLQQFSRHVAPTEPASIAMGALALLLGLAAAILPYTASGWFATIFGIAMIIMGGGEIAYATHARDWRNILSISSGAVLNIAMGALMLLNTAYFIATASALLAIWLALRGTTQMVLGLASRPKANWLPSLGSGALMLLLALAAWRRWPLSSETFLGLLVGLALVSGGLSTIWLSWRTRHQNPDSPSLPAP